MAAGTAEAVAAAFKESVRSGTGGLGRAGAPMPESFLDNNRTGWHTCN